MTAFNVVFGCAMAFLIILFSISSAARYHIKFSIFIVLASVFVTISMPFMLLRPFHPRNALFPSALLRILARTMGLSWEVRGMEHVENARGSVVLLNHQSSLDLYILAIIWPLLERCTVISKRSLQYAFPFGTAAWLWGTVYIDRGAKSAQEALNKQTRAIRDQNRKLLLFPEGTRHSGEALLPFRKGAFHVALDARALIQPIVVSRYHFLDCKRKRFGSGHIIVSILPTIDTANIPKEDIEILMEKTYAVMQDEYVRVSKEALPKAIVDSKTD